MEEIILIVDDDVENLRLLGNLLRDHQYRIALAKSGSEAISMVRASNPSLILLDVMMPDIRGYEVCRQIKKLEGAEDIPVIFLTARTDREDILEGLRAGGVDYLSKPFNSEELLLRIDNHISLRNARRTVIQQARELKKLNVLKDQVFSVISHDMKAPLASIQMLLDYLSGINPADQPELLNDTMSLIRDSTNETLLMLENLLHWSRGFKEDQSPDPAMFYPSDIIRQCLLLTDNMIRKKNITIKLVGMNDYLALSDEESYKIVFRNLLNNAIKFSPAGGEIEVLLEKTNRWIYTEIRDKGKGVNPEKKDLIFSDSAYISERGTEGEKGTGLGLKICNMLVKKQGGEIGINEKWIEGASFRFSIHCATSS
ncbi:MAG: hybrid sensor histidine kinase/response regulator [Bacteroidota bacterium]